MILQEVTVGVALFTGIVLALAILIMIARSQLMPGGVVTIKVNEERDIEVPAGGKLLSALTANQLFVPSACGGGGSCGQCRVNVVMGGGAILPVETSHITKREAADGQRLACQVPVDRNMKIQVPEAVFGVKRWLCRVRSSNYVATFIKELVLELPQGETFEFKAGGYVQIECPAHQLRYADFDIPDQYRGDWERYGFLELKSDTTVPTTRAYSLANHPNENDIAMLNVRIATPPASQPSDTPPGIVSSFLFNLQAGDAVTVSGPYGEFFAKNTDAEMIFIGGGAGMAPMRSHILDQLIRIHSQRRISFWYGARNHQEAFYIDMFNDLASKHDNFSWHLVLSEPRPNEHCSSYSGFVHDVLFEKYLSNHSAPEDCEYYLCGPPMMNSAVIDMLDNLGVERDNISFDDFVA